MINKKKYNLALLKNVQDLYQQIRKIADENRDIVAISLNNEFEIQLDDLSEESDFIFSISNPTNEKGKTEYTLEYAPKNEQSLDVSKIGVDNESAIRRLKTWISLLRQYDKIILTPEEKILEEYENEFYDDFEIIDDDAQTNPFSLDKQVLLYNFITNTVRLLEASGENPELIEEATKLNNDLPKLTKKTTIRRLSKFLAKVRQKSLPLLKEVLDVAKKELYKKVVTGGFKMIGHFIDSMT